MCIERVRAKDESGRLKLTVMSQRCYSIKCVHGWPLVHCDPSLILQLCCAAKASCLTGASCWALSQPCNIRTQILLFTTPKQYVLYIYIASIKTIQTSLHRVSSLHFLWVWTPFQKVSLCGACPGMTCASTCSCYWCIYRWVTLYLKDGVLAINVQLIYVCISAQ